MQVYILCYAANMHLCVCVCVYRFQMNIMGHW